MCYAGGFSAYFGPTDLAATVAGPLYRRCPGNVSEATQLAGGQKYGDVSSKPETSWFVISNMRFTWDMSG